MRVLPNVRMVTGYGWFRRTTTTPQEEAHALDQASQQTSHVAQYILPGNSLFSLSRSPSLSLFDVPPRHGGRTTRAADLEGVEGREEDTRGEELVEGRGEDLVAVEETDAGGRCGWGGKKDSKKRTAGRRGSGGAERLKAGGGASEECAAGRVEALGAISRRRGRVRRKDRCTRRYGERHQPCTYLSRPTSSPMM